MTQEIIITAIIVFILLLMSALLSLAETALTGSSRARILQLERKGNANAKIISRLLLIREKMIAAILIGNNIVIILSSSLTTALFLSLFDEGGILYATILSTVMIVIYGEIMPKRYALAHPERSALFLAPFLRQVETFLGPVARWMEWIGTKTLQGVGVDVTAHKTLISAHQEIKGTVALFHMEGEVHQHDKDMLGGLLDMRALSVNDVMVHRTRMDTLCGDLPISEIVEEALESQYTRMPVWSGTQDNITGILHAKNLLIALHKAGGDVEKLELKTLISAPWFVPNTTPLTEQLQAFLKHKQHFALVVDEYGVLLGHVALEDILEEIVGDIADEHDTERSGIRIDEDNSVRVDGNVSIRDLNRALDWDLPNLEATTVAGLVIHEARSIPRSGQVFTFYGYTFTVLKRQRNRITQLRINAPAVG